VSFWVSFVSLAVYVVDAMFILSSVETRNIHPHTHIYKYIYMTITLLCPIGNALGSPANSQRLKTRKLWVLERECIKMYTYTFVINSCNQTANTVVWKYRCSRKSDLDKAQTINSMCVRLVKCFQFLLRPVIFSHKVVCLCVLDTNIDKITYS